MRQACRTLSAAVLGAAGVTLVISMAPAATVEGDAVRGRLLYENHCTGCHTSRAHVRENHKAHTIEQVYGWVQRWQSAQGLAWSPEEVRDVTGWLYLRFYDPDRPTPRPGTSAGGSAS